MKRRRRSTRPPFARRRPGRSRNDRIARAAEALRRTVSFHDRDGEERVRCQTDGRNARFGQVIITMNDRMRRPQIVDGRFRAVPIDGIRCPAGHESPKRIPRLRAITSGFRFRENGKIHGRCLLRKNPMRHRIFPFPGASRPTLLSTFCRLRNERKKTIFRTVHPFPARKSRISPEHIKTTL